MATARFDTAEAGGSTMDVFPPQTRRKFQFFSRGMAGVDTWEELRWKLQHSSMLCRTAAVWRGPHGPRQLPKAEQQLDLQQLFVDADKTRTVEQCWKDAHTEGLVVVHKGTVLLEKYFNDTQAHTKMCTFSFSKSLVGVVTANLVEEGAFDYDTLLTTLLPELQGGVWEGVSVQHAVMQASGVKSEMGVEPDSAVVKDLQATGMEETPAGQEAPLLYETVKERSERLFEPGSYFDYNQSNANVVAWACQRLTGLTWPELVSKYVWSKIGAAEDGFFHVDAAGTAEAGGGFAATTMDMARYGLALMHSDNAAPAQRLLPSGFFQRVQQEGATSPGKAAVNDPKNIMRLPGYEFLGYSHYFVLGRYGEFEAVLALGHLGQIVLMQPELDVVIARLGSGADMGEGALRKDAISSILQHIAALTHELSA